MTGLMRSGHSCRTLRGEMDRLFDSFYGIAPAKEESGGSVWAPAVDVCEDENSFFIAAELPGIDRESIDLEVENNVLSIKGERKLEKKEEGESYHFVERSYGSFYRRFSLPKNVDTEGIGAEYKDGVLKISIPKKDEIKPKKVEIRL